LFSAARSRQNPDTNEDDYAHSDPGWRDIHQIRGNRESDDKYNESNEISAERRHVFFLPGLGCGSVAQYVGQFVESVFVRAD
jgi:hypothetical protein